MIPPIKGKLYKIRYIGGNLYANYHYETLATFLKLSKDEEQYVFVRDIKYEKKYWIVYVPFTNILECSDNVELSSLELEYLLLYIQKSNHFFTTSINKQSHNCYINYNKIEEFIHEYYKPETGEGYLEAFASWNSRNST